ncbi:MAG: acyltransferase domain-containing protein [Proteobacteria bacterium]|nr:acyltransferase domain-containing protein [Pseudomonadota bacterium]
MTHPDPSALPAEGSIAIVGMGCYLPDADTPDAFWQNLAAGRESVRDLQDAELRAAGVSEADLADPSYVRCGVPLDGFDQFDAAFFGLSPGEAKVMDPQHRKFIECAWSALEDAGHTPASADRNIGVFAGSGMHWYLLKNLMTNPELIRELGEFQIRHTANDKDFLATRVSYHLDLHGPSINVQTACSSSLVAVHMGCQSLLNGETDMVLAGGSTIEVPHGVGYHYREEEVRSADGRCRPMDADAGGTAFGSGCGVVVLRRLSDALADGDFIHAVIRGSAINNDGAGKAGYLAPSVEGQAQAIAEAIAVADVDPATIGYVEAHGTGTRIGDPIEVAALSQGFGETGRRQYCALGSVKSNIGHLDTAAGVAGLIKVALSMRHRKLPASLNFRSPNPEIDFAGSPFYVNSSLSDWPALGAPLRAGISSLGVGGTNAHVVLEEAPPRIGGPGASGAPEDAVSILPLSAKTPAALSAAVKNLLAHLESHPELALRDVAWTLRNGRVPFGQRIAVAGRNIEAITAQLRSVQRPIKAADAPPKVVFMFPGQGAQYPNMSRRLYATDPDFRAAMDTCFEVLRRLGRHDAIAALYTEASGAEAMETLRATAVTQPVLFCVEYALAKSLLAKGIRADAMIGHSLGEYVAACLAGVFTLEAALTLVCRRGELIGSLAPGAMLAVAMAAEDLAGYLPERACIAGINGPESCVCAGEFEAIARLAERLGADGIGTRRLETSHAFHSQMLDPILASFGAAVRTVDPAAVEGAAVISNVTGTWLTAAQAGSAEYWTSHLRQPVNFVAGMRQLQELGPAVYIEVGPGNTLSGFARAIAPDARVVPSLPHPKDATADDEVFAAAGGLLWAHGLDIDWAAWGQPASGRRVPLPTYPFQRQRHWVEPGLPERTGSPVEDNARKPFEDWFHVADWQSTVAAAGPGVAGRALVFAGSWGVAASLVDALRARGVDVVTVELGREFSRSGNRIVIDPNSDADWDTLADQAGTFSHLVYLWPLDTAMACTTKIIAGCFDHLLRIGKHIDRFCDAQGLKLLVATANAHQLGGEEAGNPHQALVSGPVRTIPQEYPGVRAKWVDFDEVRIEWSPAETAAQLMIELQADGEDETIAWRNRRRMRSVLTPMPLARTADPVALRTGGSYLITGAFGGAGLVLAQYLARRYQAHLVLVARTPLPPAEARDAYLAKSRPGDAVRRRIQAVGLLESSGARVDVVAADVANGRALESAVAELGVTRLDGIFHAAGVLDDATIGLKSVTAAHRVLHPKVAGALGLQSLKPLCPDFIVYFSSISARAGVAGQVDYTAANAFLDAFAARADAQSSTTRHIAVGWSSWRDAGMAASLAAKSGFAPPEPADADLTDHPVLTWTTSGEEGRCCYSGMLTPESAWFLDQHRLKSGEAILPGTAYLDLIVAAMQQSRGRFGPLCISGMTLIAPLVLRPREKRLLRIEIAPKATVRNEVAAKAADATDTGRHVITVSSVGGDPDDVLDHAAAEVSLRMPEPDVDREPLPAPAGLLPVEGTYSHPALDFGPRWDCLTRLEAAGNDALLRLDLKTPEDLTRHPLHPALLDLAIGAAQQVLAGPELGARLLPYRYGEILVLAPLTRSVEARVRARCEPDRLTLDVEIRSDDGQLLLVFRDFVLKQAPPGPLASGAERSRGTPKRPAASEFLQAGFEDGLSNEEAVAALESVLASHGPAQVIVATRDVQQLLKQARRNREPAQATTAGAGEVTAVFLPRPEMGVEYVPPESDLQRMLVATWEAMLEIRGIGIRDNFFELGGNSLLLMRLVSRLNRQQGIALPLEQVLEEPIIASWSTLAADSARDVAPVKPITRVDRSKHKVSLPS